MSKILLILCSHKGGIVFTRFLAFLFSSSGGKQRVSDCISAMQNGVEYPTSFVEASQKGEAQRAEQEYK